MKRAMNIRIRATTPTNADRVNNLIYSAQNEYKEWAAVAEKTDRMREQYCSTSWKVKSLAPAPMASSMADLPADFMKTFLEAAYDANDAIESLRRTISDVMKALPEIVLPSLQQKYLVIPGTRQAMNYLNRK
jgi:hypothetical protein